MSDSKLRELERRWRETRSVEDEAAYLRERVRVGDLTQERLELAAYCGHEGAKLATGSQQEVEGLEDWVIGLRRWDASVGVRAAVAAGRLLPGAENSAAVRAAEAWLRDPTPERAKAVQTAVRQERAKTPRQGGIPVNEIELAVTSAGLPMVSRMGIAGFPGSGECPEVASNRDPKTAATWTVEATVDVVESALAIHPKSHVRFAMTSEISHWALEASEGRSPALDSIT